MVYCQSGAAGLMAVVETIPGLQQRWETTRATEHGSDCIMAKGAATRECDMGGQRALVQTFLGLF